MGPLHDAGTTQTVQRGSSPHKDWRPQELHATCMALRVWQQLQAHVWCAVEHASAHSLSLRVPLHKDKRNTHTNTSAHAAMSSTRLGLACLQAGRAGHDRLVHKSGRDNTRRELAATQALHTQTATMHDTKNESKQAHSCTQACTHAHTHTHTQHNTNARTRTYSHARTHTYMHTCMHTDRQTDRQTTQTYIAPRSDSN